MAPNKRRKGDSKILADYQLEFCKNHGFDHLNLSTYYQNESVKMLEHYPFKIIENYKTLYYTQKGLYDDFDTAMAFDKVLVYFTALNISGHYACDWIFFTLDDDMIKRFFDRGEIFRLGSDYVILSDLYNKDKSLSLVFASQIKDDLMALVKGLIKVVVQNTALP